MPNREMDNAIFGPPWFDDEKSIKNRLMDLFFGEGAPAFVNETILMIA